MPIFEIRKFPDPILAKESSAVADIDGRVAGLMNGMVDTMYAANGIGLAAPQVGFLQHVIVVDIDPDNRGKKLLKIINPAITESEGEITTDEGCLSFVNLTTEVTRARRILLTGWTLNQEEIHLEAEDLEAVCIQHEIDHLEGTLLTDHISRLKRELYRKRLKRMSDSPDPSADERTANRDPKRRL